jgi:hypothetical protein
METSMALILGTGPRTGESVTKAFTSRGYKAAIASRSRELQTQGGWISMPVVLANPSQVVEAFQRVESTWGPPNVVIYIGKQMQPDVEAYAK